MRKEIQNHSGRHAKFFAQQKSIVEFPETFALRDDNELVHDSGFENLAHVALWEDADQLHTPILVVLDAPRKFMRLATRSDDRNVARIQGAVSFRPGECQPVGEEEDIIN